MKSRKDILPKRQVYEGPVHWLWIVGMGRIFVLFVVTSGFYFYLTKPQIYFFLPIYIVALILSVWHLFEIYKGIRPLSFLLWAQMFVDFGVVCATIGITRGCNSPFTFLLVIVIMEAGFLLGIYQGFLFAIFSFLFMGFQFAVEGPSTLVSIEHWYPFLIQTIAFLFTGFITGYWNQRVLILKQFQQDILDNMNSGFLITDANGIIRSINKGGCSIFEVEEKDVIGAHVEGLIRTVEGFECPITTALKSNRDFTSYEFYIYTPSGNQKLIGLTTNRLFDKKGRIASLIASCTDLSELDHIRQDLRRHDRLAAIGEQLSSLAHEIRNPVASIRSAVAEMQNSINEPEVLNRLVNIAVRECDRLNYIITSFLDFAREPIQTKNVISLPELLEEFVEQFKQTLPTTPTYNVELRTIMKTEHCKVKGDKEQLLLVFRNLAQNAIDAMKNGGTLTILLMSPTEKGPIEIHFKDEGVGIPPDKITRIFEPFYTEKKQGVGMGLTISLRIISSHDGTIRVISNPKKGTTMIIRLPRYTE
ncbi:MAG TPA: ATP-binding protein [Candidatus Hydrogenedens sp.]|nr:ATP-binding protein [Candidatus Hydrogenedens sp.]HPP59577.1 ATP-binding protein [Candidatus Hydrogenedens sp.]